jgi:mannose-6-phosphate isomerase-like protein (cupin superfamily)
MYIKYKMACCDKYYNSRTPIHTLLKCPYCMRKDPPTEELDKDDWVFSVPFSGDKQFENRPWGSYKVLKDGENIKVKEIIVEPNQRVSLHLHRLRDEVWYVVSGFGMAQLNNEDIDLSEGVQVSIERYKAHRIENTGLFDLIIIEIQTGECKEGDDVRLEDDYNRPIA